MRYRRRQHHGETDAIVAAKATAARRVVLLTIICIGETNAQRQAGRALSVCGEQIAGSVPDGMLSSGTAIGYEPLWAIGSGAEGNEVRILYGGSVKPANARAILALPEVGGVLVGGATLNAADLEVIFSAVPTRSESQVAGEPGPVPRHA